MKKKYLLLFLGVILVVVSLVVYSCRKNQSKPTEQSLTLNVASASKLDDEALLEGSCQCPAGYSVCAEDCAFSSCCVCCPPGRACGAGCWLGVAQCVCEDPGGERIAGSNSVTIKEDNLQRLFVYMETEMQVDITSLKELYDNMQINQTGIIKGYAYGKSRTGNAFKVDHAYYSPFATYYRELTGSLSREQQGSIASFITTL